TVRTPGKGAADYQDALGQAERACRQLPDEAFYLTALGAARYRLGRYEEALGPLRRVGELEPSRAPALAFRALAEYQAGHEDQARAGLDRLRELLKSDPWAKDAAARALFEEAEALLGEPPRERLARLAAARARAGDWPQAAAQYGQLIQREDSTARHFHFAGLARLGAGDEEGYRQGGGPPPAPLWKEPRAPAREPARRA